MIARALPTTTTTVVSAINKGVFIVTSLLRAPKAYWSPSYPSLNEPPVNARCNSSAAEWRSPVSGVQS
jgi:hypothetical protein